jgi:hypothetical protein
MSLAQITGGAFTTAKPAVTRCVVIVFTAAVRIKERG